MIRDRRAGRCTDSEPEDIVRNGTIALRGGNNIFSAILFLYRRVTATIIADSASLPCPSVEQTAHGVWSTSYPQSGSCVYTTALFTFTTLFMRMRDITATQTRA